MVSLVHRIRQDANLSQLLRRLTFRSRHYGPIEAGDKFITLNEDYLDKFDEIVIIGDVHGCSDEFEEALNKIHSETPTKDCQKVLKILVGDLVNKGPNSRRVLKLCAEKYYKSTLAVRGNHDEIVLSIRDNYERNKKAPIVEKNEWIKSLPSSYISYLRRLPYTISLPSLKCVIVHAGLQPFIDEPAKATPTYLMTTMRNIVVSKDPKSGEISYNGTKSIEEGAAWATFWPGPEHVYFGHDARRRLQDNHEFATGLDTGCVYGDRLSYIYVKGSRKGEIVSIGAKRVYEPTKSDDDDDDKKANRQAGDNNIEDKRRSE